MKVFNLIHKCIIILFFSLLIGYYVKFLKTKKVLGYSFAEVVGTSMYPNLQNGDIIIIKAKARVEIGDVICFEDAEHRLIVHRIVEFAEDGLITKGDYNKFNDEQITYSQIVGKVVFKSSILGWVVDNAHILIFGIFVMVIVISNNKYNKMCFYT